MLVALIACYLAAPVFEVNYPRDASLTAGALVSAGLFALIPMREQERWQQELLPFDAQVKDNFSAKAATTSDALVALVVTLPLAAQLPDGITNGFGKRALIYAQTLSITLALNTLSKYLVQRPRPYTYNPNPLVRAYQMHQKDDAFLSFYSGHAATSFAAAVSGAYLFAARSADVNARAAFWATELGLATAAANMRVRAGKHFYSDVIAGALLGAGAGWLVPWLHQPNEVRYAPTSQEALGMASGMVGGFVLSQLMPVGDNIVVPIATSSSVGMAAAIAW